MGGIGLIFGRKTGGIASYFEAQVTIDCAQRSSQGRLKPGWINAEVIFARALRLKLPKWWVRFFEQKVGQI